MSGDPLSEEDQAHGHLMLILMSDWSAWIKRRVEKVVLINETAVRRSVSVDLCIRDWFGEPVVTWGDEEMYYLPLGLLSKTSETLDLDIRDEASRALPLLTRRKRAAIAAATLTALARTLVAGSILQARAMGRTETTGLPTNFEAPSITVPHELQVEFFRIAYSAPEPRGGELSTTELVERFVSAPLGPPKPPWWWSFSARGDRWQAAVPTVDWLRLLIADERFRRLLDDLAENLSVLVPVAARPGARRVVKLGWEEHRNEPLRKRGPVKRWIERRGFYRVADAWEGIADLPAEQWRPPTRDRGRTESGRLGRFGRFFGWFPHPLVVFTPGLRYAGSYHFEFEAPPGLQIRHASLSILPEEGRPPPPPPSIRGGVRSVRRIHLHIENAPPAREARVLVYLKAAHTNLLRGATGAAAIGLLLLWFTFIRLESITEPAAGRVGPTAALLALLPGILAGMVVRGDEHPMTTTVLFGQRITTMSVALWPAIGAGLLLAARDATWLNGAWMALLVLAVLSLLILAVGWRLASRRRPDGSAP